MPSTMLNWNKAAMRPRLSVGAISVMYVGPTTEEAPTPSPPTKRNTTNHAHDAVNAEPNALSV